MDWNYNTVATVREVLDAMNIIDTVSIENAAAFRFPILTDNHIVAWSVPNLVSLNSDLTVIALETVIGIGGHNHVDPYYDDGTIQGRSVLAYPAGQNDLSIEAGHKVRFNLSKALKPFFGKGNPQVRGRWTGKPGTFPRRVRLRLT